MKNYVIITDSSCNLTTEQKDKYGIAAIVPMHFYLDGKEYDASGDWSEISAVEYYDRIRDGAKVRSSQASSYSYEETFRKYLEQGFDVLSLSCAEALSSSVKESIAAAKRLEKDFPDAKIYCVDTYNCCYSLAMLVIEAAKRRDAGGTIDEVRDWVTDKRACFNEVGTVDKLTYLRNAGRVGGAAAFFGGVFSVKPIIVYDETGHNNAFEKVRGRRGSLERVADLIKEYADIDANRHICIAHANCLEDAKTLGEMVKERFAGKEIHFEYGFIEPGIGSAVGPGTIIVGFFGDPQMRTLGK